MYLISVNFGYSPEHRKTGYEIFFAILDKTTDREAMKSINEYCGCQFQLNRDIGSILTPFLYISK